MKYLITFLLFFGINAHAYMSHDEIVRNIQMNKVGKAPQQCAKGKSCKPIKPKYNKLDEVLPHHVQRKKAHKHKEKVSKNGEKK